MERVMKGVKRLLGEVDIAGDKSVSHRAIMTNAIADGDAKITNFLLSIYLDLSASTLAFLEKK